VKGSTPGLLSSRITIPARTDRGKSLNALVKLAFGWKREHGAFLKKLLTHVRVFARLAKECVTEFVHRKPPLCSAPPETSLFYLTCMYVTVWQMALQVGTIFLSLSYIDVCSCFQVRNEKPSPSELPAA
jgi:hypothetical protein